MINPFFKFGHEKGVKFTTKRLAHAFLEKFNKTLIVNQTSIRGRIK